MTAVQHSAATRYVDSGRTKDPRSAVRRIRSSPNVLIKSMLCAHFFKQEVSLDEGTGRA